MKKVTLLALTVALAFFSWQPTLGAQEEKDVKKQEEKSESAKKFDEISKKMDGLISGWSTKVRSVQAEMAKATPEERNKINQDMMAAQKDLLENAKKIAAEMITLTKSMEKDVAFNAIKWVLTSPYVQDPELKKQAVSKIGDHLDNKSLGLLLKNFGRGQMPAQATEDLFRMVAEKSNVPEVQGLAIVSLAGYLRQNSSTVAGLLDNPAFAKAYPDSMDYFKKLAATKDEDVEGLLAKAVEKFGDVKYGTSTIGEFAGRELKVMKIQKNLKVGKVAPDIEGPDIDGVDFKLSDYRGKVVMLDFWGDW